ncbi:MAG: OmpH family outer membrane protein, partial [Acidobacteriota bacterium]|nr:OmpH family outer membrane protein [Acidobacteriota bacterium]
MRNTLSKIAVVACILAAPILGLAQGGAPEKIGVIDIQVAISDTAEGKSDLAKLEKKYAPRRAALQTEDKEISALQDRLQNQSGMLSDDEKYSLSRQLDQKQRHFKEDQDDATADYQADTQEMVRTIGQKMVKLIGQYAQQHQLSLVIGTQQVPVYYA